MYFEKISEAKRSGWFNSQCSRLNVRFTPKSGHWNSVAGSPLYANSPKSSLFIRLACLHGLQCPLQAWNVRVSLDVPVPMTKGNHSDKRRALIIGGSLGGLFAGNLLSQIGWHVEIFERSVHDLDSRGGGIVLQPEVVEVFRRAGVDIRNVDLGVRSQYRTVFRHDGSIQSKHFAPQTQTSWSLIYTTLKAACGDWNYHQAKTLVRIDQDTAAGRVTAHFEDGTCETGGLLVGADGGNSVVRQQFWPTMQPTYAGYLAWRGLVPEDEMPATAREMLHGDFGFANNKGSHILGYLVPGDHNDVRPGHRLYNWVWYRVADESMLGEIMTDRNGDPYGYAIAEGLLADRWVEHLHRDAENLLPLPFREVVEATTQPFAQPSATSL
jgi:2-polyprenyl-6-methoxyphenol hydroxylase-like FAD-dependent oxidoreductase